MVKSDTKLNTKLNITVNDVCRYYMYLFVFFSINER